LEQGAAIRVSREGDGKERDFKQAAADRRALGYSLRYSSNNGQQCCKRQRRGTYSALITAGTRQLAAALVANHS